MMKQAILNNSIVDIKDFELNWYDKKIICQCCNEDVVICRGVERQYFRHKNGSECAYSNYSEDKNTQSVEHILCKEFLYNQLLRYNSDIFVKKEFPLFNGDNKCIADVYAEYSYNDIKFKYAFEIQKSPKSEKNLILKNEFYRSLNIIPIWISWYDINLNKFQINQNAFFKNSKISGRYKFKIEKENISIFYEISKKSIIECDLKIKNVILNKFKLYGNKIFYL